MSLIPFTSTPIEIPISDRVIGDTQIKQKATFVSLTHTQENGESRAAINVLVTMYAASGSTYGDQLAGRGIAPYTVILGAANDTLVSVAPGSEGTILAVRTNESNEAWKAIADLHPEPVMFQGDFFEMLREQPVKIGGLIRQHIQNADALGRFAL